MTTETTVKVIIPRDLKLPAKIVTRNIYSTPSGATGSFTTVDNKTVTVVNGIITDIV